MFLNIVMARRPPGPGTLGHDALAVRHADTPRGDSRGQPRAGVPRDVAFDFVGPIPARVLLSRRSRVMHGPSQEVLDGAA